MESRIGGHPSAALAMDGRPVPHLAATVHFPCLGLLGAGLFDRGRPGAGRRPCPALTGAVRGEADDRARAAGR
ncbi:hypothetical protein J3S85_00380 [Streptomyces lavenduligriseus]|nr:hypothetical protein J3S85_00380 [Streptomyces lavenduligriseus]